MKIYVIILKFIFIEENINLLYVVSFMNLGNMKTIIRKENNIMISDTKILTSQIESNLKQPLLDIQNKLEHFFIKNLDSYSKLEFDRTKKVLECIITYINLLDPDLLPSKFYSDIQQIKQITSMWNMDILYLSNILDQIISILVPYGFCIPNTIAQSLAKINLYKVKKDAKAIEDYGVKLLSANDSIQKQIAKAQEDINNWYNEIHQFRDKFFVKQDNSNISLETEIQNAKITATNILKDIKEKGKEFSQTKDKLDKFYYKIFGNNEVKGLKQELEERENQLDNYDKQQKEKIEKNWEQIYSLIEKATDAGLAVSYNKAKNAYDSPIRRWNAVFIATMICIVLVGYGSVFGLSWWKITMTPANIDYNDYRSVLNLIVSRLPFYIPLGWLAIFATRRRNEIKRLQEEYRHKEAVATSYSGYMGQINNIKDENERERLTVKLMDNLLK